jgi:formylglycine-generating enzyme required for sulfatase activity
VNVISHEQAEAMSQDPFFPVPVGSSPANSSGLGDFAKSGLEWVRDWYDDNYYAHSSKLDPAGPAAGDLKVVRGAQASSSVPAMTMTRTGRRPDGVDEKVDKLFQEQGFKPIRFGATFRCVTQQ